MKVQKHFQLVRVQLLIVRTSAFGKLLINELNNVIKRDSAHAHHYVVVNEALAVAGRLEVGVLFSAGDPNVPHAPPRLVELQVHRVDS